MRAKFINEIKQNRQSSGLGSIGIGSIATNKAYHKINAIMGYNYLQYDDKITSFSSIKEPEITFIKDFLKESLQCELDEIIIIDNKILPPGITWDLIDPIIFYQYAIKPENFITFTHNSNFLYKEGQRKEHKIRIECWTSPEWAITQIIVYRDYTKTYEREGNTYFAVRYK